VYHQRNSDEVTGGNPCNIKTYHSTVHHAVSFLKINKYKGSKFRLWVLTNIYKHSKLRFGVCYQNEYQKPA
jgi:hypothetical protein